MVVAIFRD